MRTPNTNRGTDLYLGHHPIVLVADEVAVVHEDAHCDPAEVHAQLPRNGRRLARREMLWGSDTPRDIFGYARHGSTVLLPLLCVPNRNPQLFRREQG
jgi:hypothetical protein